MSEHQTILSPDRVYRYTLWRTWDTGEDYVLFLGLNPSTADETEDDPTIRRERSFARAWGFSGMAKGNLFAYRATDPYEMKQRSLWIDAIGPDNDLYLQALAGGAKMIVAGWGVHGAHNLQNLAVLSLLQHYDIYALKLTADGHPGHPLYLPANSLPFLWRPAVK